LAEVAEVVKDHMVAPAQPQEQGVTEMRAVKLQELIKMVKAQLQVQVVQPVQVNIVNSPQEQEVYIQVEMEEITLAVAVVGIMGAVVGLLEEMVLSVAVVAVVRH
jgi:hypothetical protein